MSQRLNVSATLPAAYKALSAVEKELASTDLPKTVRELVKIRASQLNGCAFCLVMHTRDARADGESEDRVNSVAAWREAEWFSAEERAALAYTEEATRLGPDGVSDVVWKQAAACFEEEQLAALVVAVGMINLWNRIAVPTRTPPA